MRGLELELDSLRTQKGDEVKLLMENLSAIEKDYGYFESRAYEIMNAFQGAQNRVRELEEQLRGKTHETETDQMPGVQEEEERKSYEDEDEDDAFEFPTPADKIIPVYPIFGRDKLDGVPAGTYCVSGRVKQPEAGGGVTVAQERDRRRRLLMPYKQEGFFANVKMLTRNVKQIGNALKAINSKVF
ncbi:uncharacterized protein LOC114272321 [Camellia sinensis]|uniref:uncharacterized protein LOC114272321 n=1 Tax=Camellia sinensis TaxID=4442 RepID=UPI0010357B5C|nr:uncharacterized protein LOC114272321 [Camellia sinensis]